MTMIGLPKLQTRSLHLAQGFLSSKWFLTFDKSGS
jgi:hypothetical protein